MSSGLFKNGIDKMCLKIIYLIYMYKEDLVLNNLQCLICHKTKPNNVIVCEFDSHLVPYTSSLVSNYAKLSK